MRILLTGATGFIGNNLLKSLENHEIYATGREYENNAYNLIGYDFSNLPWEYLPKIDCLIHQAACTDTLNICEEYQEKINFSKPMELFRQAIEHGCKKIVYASSCSVYGDLAYSFREDGPVKPLIPYAQAKLRLDFASQELDAVVIGLRYTNVYGRGEDHKGPMASMVSQICRSIKERERPRLFKDGTQSRDWVYVKDVVKANLLAMNAKKSGIYNIGSGTNVSFNEIVKNWNFILGTDITPEYIENPFKGRYQNHTVVDISKAAELGYYPDFQVFEGMKDMV